jgi:L-ascorbate metabolism protein UlaG (beta-lactamase superfamily)
MIRPLLQDDAFLADVDAARAQPGALHVWWLGQSGFLVQWKGRHLLFDPYLSDSLTQKYAATDQPHVRMTERVIDPARLGFVEVATSSHNHTDHLDADTLLPLLAANPGLRLVLPAANRAFAARRLGLTVDAPLFIDLDDGATADLAPFHITGLPAAHESLQQDAQGRHAFLGFLVRVGPFTLYHSGDCVDYPGLAERLAPEKIDLAFLPINGRAPARRVTGNFDGPEAADLARRAGIPRVVPCHYELFAFNTASPRPFLDACTRLGVCPAVLRAGERLTLHARN